MLRETKFKCSAPSRSLAFSFVGRFTRPFAVDVCGLLEVVRWYAGSDARRRSMTFVSVDVKVEPTHEREEDDDAREKAGGNARMTPMPTPRLPEPDVCAICLSTPKTRALLDSCAHVFCVKCLERWARVETRCPLCKTRFTTATPVCGDDASKRVGETLVFKERNQGDGDAGGEAGEESEEDEADLIFCDVCRSGDDEECLLLCDACDVGCHTYCVGLESVPVSGWFCETCRGGDERFFGRSTTSSRARGLSSASSRARDILLSVEGGETAVRSRERRVERERRAAHGRRRGERRARGGGGERAPTGDDVRVRQITRVHELRQAWSLLQSGEMEFPGWHRSATAPVAEPPRVSVPPPASRREDDEGPKTVVEDAWDVLEKAMRDDEKKKSAAKKRSDKSSSSTAVASPSRQTAKRPKTVREAPGWSMSATAWAPIASTSRAPPPACHRPAHTLTSMTSTPTTKTPPPPKPPPTIKKSDVVSKVKDILRPMYAARSISRDEYKRVCQSSTERAVADAVTNVDDIKRIVHIFLPHR